jgi:uncharacterized Zn finger protein
MKATAYVLARTDDARLTRAMGAPRKGEYHISGLQVTGGIVVSATVTNGDKRPYSVVISPSQASCSCPDATYRKGAVCKHAVALGVRVILDGVELAPEKGGPDLRLGKAKTTFTFAP